MSEKDIPKKYNELRSIYKDYIDVYNLLYQLKTENEEELNSIYIMIKTELTESIKLLPQNIIRDISNMVPYNNRYTKSYLLLAKFISDEYHVTNVRYVEIAFNFLFYKEYGIKLDKSSDFEEIKSLNLDIHTENTIYRAIMNDDKETFISCTEREGFNRYQTLKSKLYPKSKEREELRSYIYSCSDRGYSLLELCCYHGAVDCFKFLRTKFKSEITQKCLQLSFLGRSKEIMSECLKHKKPDEECKKYAIISHNIDFVTFLMNEYKKKIDVYNCRVFKNLESFLVYYDQIHNYHRCIVHSAGFTIPSLLEYFISHGGFINKSDKYGETSLHYAARYNSKEIAERLLSRGANINKKDNSGKTALHIAAMVNSKEVAELLLSRGANINERDNSGKIALHIAASKNSKETLELLISCGANINEKANSGKSALRIAVWQNHKEIVEVLIAYGANINEKSEYGLTALHVAAMNNYKEIVELLISHGANIHEKDKCGNTALQCAVWHNSKETADVLISHGANIHEKDKCGNTALQCAVWHNSKETADVLISHGANIHEKDKCGNTALQCAVWHNSKETADVLISHGANIHEKDKCGNTALYYATVKNYKEILELLISHGAVYFK